MVSVTSDQFVNKGPNRPFFDLSKRIEMLKSFKFIDFVIPSFFETAEKNLHIVKPNLYVKGNDYLNKGRSDDKNLFKEISILKK